MIAISSPEKVRPAMGPVCQLVRETLVWPTRSEISWLNAPSLEPPNITNTLVRPNKARASCSPNTAASCRQVCAAYIKETPRARSLAIRVRNVGSGAVDGNSSEQASIGGHNRPYPDWPANPRAVSRTCSATAVINGDADAYGSSRPNK